MCVVHSSDRGPGEPDPRADGRRRGRDGSQRAAVLVLPGALGPAVRLDHAAVRAAVQTSQRARQLEGKRTEVRRGDLTLVHYEY